ncbi:hypothetical protein PHABIO_5 [Pseudomonas phage Phabio]|uniref:Uncharacterized protein n=1 Tax=Pseudomonas phage Phabio TaxID=2006668 RepID=A0A1Y0SYA4_9CAUD|nr:hypothetical protein MZD05_gp005 [Pseudomonas phage Phabio]ARV76636.1 hypothetical protein PHABIO_5 [Pseudomonas phage Phabio]
MDHIEPYRIRMNYDEFQNYMRGVFDQYERQLAEECIDLDTLDSRVAAIKNAGGTETRMLYREPNPAFVNFDWNKSKPEPVPVEFKPAPIPRQPVKKKARDYHCGVATAFCDDLKETIRCQVGDHVDLSFFDYYESDDLFSKEL